MSVLLVVATFWTLCGVIVAVLFWWAQRQPITDFDRRHAKVDQELERLEGRESYAPADDPEFRPRNWSA
jgi:hypothetical protein